MANPLDHPLFARVSHYINLINFLVLVPTGFLIHFPYTGMPMNLVRNLHFIFMYSFLFNGIVRFYWSLFSKHKDLVSSFLWNKNDLKNLWPQIKYYLFIGKHPNNPNKYNPLQKTAYLSFPVLALLQVATGLLLYMPEKFGGVVSALGGMAAVRGMHYLIMIIFLAIIAVHVYLVFTEAYEMFWLMFFGKTEHKKGI